MQKKLLIIGDPLQKLNLANDSSLALAEVALAEHFAVYWCEMENIYFGGTEIFVHNPIQLTEISTTKITQIPRHFDKAKTSETRSEHVPFSKFDYCFIRKDPPFNEAYKDLCWILSSQTKVKIINPAEALLAYHEKALQWRAFSEGVLTEKQIIPTCLSSSPAVIEDFCKSHKFLFSDGFISKPWLGHGGADVTRHTSFADLLHTLQNTSEQLMMVQPFLKEVLTEGGRRVLFAGGKIIGDYVLVPQKGKVTTNLSQGGVATIQKMTSEQTKICLKIGEFLKEKSISFAGLDLISHYVCEINITSPTGLRTFAALTGHNIARKAFHLLAD